MWYWKRTWEPLQISINKGPQPREKTILRNTNFLQDKLFKQGSSLKCSQASFIYAWSLQITNLYWIKPKRPIWVLQQHFEDKSKVLFKALNHWEDSWRYKFPSRQAFQARKLSQKLSSPLHLRLKSTKNEALLDQV